MMPTPLFVLALQAARKPRPGDKRACQPMTPHLTHTKER
jgi:hypothetical protein